MILIALGSNLGDRAAMLAKALEALAEGGVRVLKQSALYETPALLPKDAPKEWNIHFLNQVAQIETGLDPQTLLSLLKATEQRLGRTVRGRWSPREIDLDLLAYHDRVISSGLLTLPHPQLHHRRFVLEPLVEIAPEWLHPLLGKSAAQLWAELGQ